MSCRRQFGKLRRRTLVGRLREKQRDQKRDQTAKRKAQTRARRCAYNHRNPQKVKVWGITNRLIAKGLLTRAPCEICGQLPSEAHHEDYSQPLQIRWLCTTHHRELTYPQLKDPISVK